MRRVAGILVCSLLGMVLAVPAVADRDYKRDYKGHHGYRERPYDRHRHYDREHHREREYIYRGHWRSWNDFDRYARKHPWMHKYGRYYRENEHLMFRFCDPDSGSCFFFSIGR